MALGAGVWGLYAYIASAPERALSHYEQGMRLLGPGDFTGAAAEFTKAIEILPGYADAYLGRGKARQAAGQNDAALADFDRTLALNPTLDLAYTSRGTLWRERGETQRALDDFSHSIRLHPTAEAYYQRGLTYQTLHRAQSAVDDYDRAIEHDRGAPSMYRARAEAKRELGDLAGAQHDQAQAEHVEKTQ